MDKRRLGIFFKISCIIAIISIVCLIITQKGSAEFYISIFSLILSAIVLIVCSILLNKKGE